ncbi:hypothetical protein [Candidatus Laterigemmans baculatus]|uniref:hypothetical protein n=1 Tax=Candidatus Laterigemmans baculatus TaxID=2770505 RepID=UPI0013D9B50F|nr:hypothetical protein [Candidatus Laterigemmans baculatus]
MGQVRETISTINSVIRTLLVLAISGVVLATGYVIYDRIHGTDQRLDETRQALVAARAQLGDAELRIGELEVDVAEKQRQIERMEVAMRLLKMDHRLARLEVVEQTADEETGDVETTLAFIELSPEGNPIGERREFTIRGDVVYLDNWVVKFEDQYVEQADLARGTSLVLFRRIFGEYQTPSEGYAIDPVGSLPSAYHRGGQPSEFEQEIWDDFWTFANDREEAMEKGIRAAHGEAVSMKVEPGRNYRVVLRASDGLSIVPEDAEPAE